ncbi:MAG: SIMPL domain-containing protein [Candidatus Omnitrophota bacterium]|nr:SIMPL domain-containing protein [Candidatus Omnitrophota bacterium]
MRKFSLIILSLALFFVISLGKVYSLANAEEKKQDVREISTTGEAKVWIEPDRARVYLGVETMRETIDLGREENAATIKEIIEALKSLNIKGMLIKAPNYNVSLVKEPEHDATRQGRLPKIIGYKVMQYFTVLLQSNDAIILSKDAGLVIDTALNNGVNIIENIEFFKEDDSADKRNALTLAVKAAISNAEIIAKTSGVAIKAYTMIGSNLEYSRPVYSQMQQFVPSMARGEADTSTTLIAGRIAITVNVSLRCSIE